MARLIKIWKVDGGTYWGDWCNTCQTSGGYKWTTYIVTDSTITPAETHIGCTTCEAKEEADEEADR